MPNFCPKCGAKVNPGDLFCKNCGADLTGLVEETPVPSQIPSKSSPILKIIGLGVWLLTLYFILMKMFYLGAIGIIILIIIGILSQRKKSKIESKFEKPPVPVQIPLKRSEPPVFIEIIKAGIQIFFVVLILYWVWYSYGCATGKYPNTGDRICQSIYQAFRGGGTRGGGGGTTGGGGGTTGGGTKQISIGCQHCSPGYCYVEGHCCPSSAQYYCNGYCYRSSSEAYNAGCHWSSWTRYCCY